MLHRRNRPVHIIRKWSADMLMNFSSASGHLTHCRVYTLCTGTRGVSHIPCSASQTVLSTTRETDQCPEKGSQSRLPLVKRETRCVWRVHTVFWDRRLFFFLTFRIRFQRWSLRNRKGWWCLTDSHLQNLCRSRNLRALPWSGLLNKTRPLQRTSSVPLETRSCTARRPNHIRPGVPPRGVTLDPQCSAALVSMGNDWQHWAQRSRHTPRCPRSPRCSAALVSMGNDWQHWAEWTRRGLAYERNIAKCLIDETSVVCLLLQLERWFFLQDQLWTPHL